MKVKALTISCCFCIVTLSTFRAQPLPKRAKILVDRHFEGNIADQDKAACEEMTVKASTVAHRIGMYHPITFTELHDKYSYVACGIDGHILLDRKTFFWRLYLTDQIETNYPDGVQRMLAGKPDPQ